MGRLASAGHGANGYRFRAIRCQRMGPLTRRENLFIVDGSVFVTSGSVNPTSTIQAIALYIADQMKSRLTNLTEDVMPAGTSHKDSATISAPSRR